MQILSSAKGPPGGEGTSTDAFKLGDREGQRDWQIWSGPEDQREVQMDEGRASSYPTSATIPGRKDLSVHPAVLSRMLRVWKSMSSLPITHKAPKSPNYSFWDDLVPYECLASVYGGCQGFMEPKLVIVLIELLIVRMVAAILVQVCAILIIRADLFVRVLVSRIVFRIRVFIFFIPIIIIVFILT